MNTRLGRLFFNKDSLALEKICFLVLFGFFLLEECDSVFHVVCRHSDGL